MSAIMISVPPETCERVATGACTILVKKSMPKIEEPIKCYLYCTKAKQAKDKLVLTPFGYAVGDYESDLAERGDGKVIGEFICDRLIQYNCDRDFEQYFVAGYLGAYMPLREMYLTQKDLLEYGKGKSLYGWHISNLTIYDEPREISEFRVPCKFAYSSYETGICYEDCIQGRLEDCRNFCLPLTRPPQSWQYVEAKLEQIEKER